MERFEAVLGQINVSGITSIASAIRQGEDQRAALPGITIPGVECRVTGPPTHGSYNLVYIVMFDDGVYWVLKVPVSGHRGAWDDLAVEALTSEANTMRLIRNKTSIPVPGVHHFDPSFNNPIGCPYVLIDFIEGRSLHEVWWDNKYSESKLQQVRMRALQTLAKHMADHSQLTSPQGGMLKFDTNGQLVGIGGARVPDNHAMYARNKTMMSIPRPTFIVVKAQQLTLCRHRCLCWEREIAKINNNDHLGKRVTLITRLSPLVGSLENAAENPWSSSNTMRQIFDQMRDVMIDLNQDTLSDLEDSDEQDEEEDLDDAKSEDEDGHDEMDDQISSSALSNHIAKAEKEVDDVPCLQYSADKQIHVNDRKLARFPGFHNMATSLQRHDDTIPSPKSSRKARLASFLLGNGENGCRKGANLLHRREDSEVESIKATKDSEMTGSTSILGGEDISTNKQRCKAVLIWLFQKLKSFVRRLCGGNVEKSGDFEAQVEEIKAEQEKEETQNVAQERISGHMQYFSDAFKASRACSNPKLTDEGVQTNDDNATEAWDRIALEVRNCGGNGTTIKALQPRISDLVIKMCKIEQKRVTEEEEAEEARRVAEASLSARKARMINTTKKIKVARTAEAKTSAVEHQQSHGRQQGLPEENFADSDKPSPVDSTSPGSLSPMNRKSSSKTSLTSSEKAHVDSKLSLKSELKSENNSKSTAKEYEEDYIGVVQNPIATEIRDNDEAGPENGKNGGAEPMEQASQVDETLALDDGRFNIVPICAALGKGDLDEKRRERLKTAFHLLMDSLCGER